MKLKLEPHAWADGEAYTVHIDGGSERGFPHVGHLWRRSPTSWGFKPGETFDPRDDGAPTIQCDDSASALAQVAEKIRILELPSDRLSNEQMYKLTTEVLTSLAVLAKQTEARPGYMSALAAAVSRSIVIDVRQDGEEPFMKAFIDEIAANTKSLRTIGAAADALAGVFAALMKSTEESDDERPAAQHH